MSNQITKSDLTKANDNQLNENQLNFLLSKTPKKHIYERPGKGGSKWKYVTGTYIRKCLNLMFGWDWDFEIIDEKILIESKQVIVKGKLTCRSNGSAIIKMQYGRKDIAFRRGTNEPLDLGNDLKSAATDCLKKCAAEIGLASDVYAPNEFKEIQIKESPLTQLDLDDIEESKRLDSFIESANNIDELELLEEHSNKDQYKRILERKKEFKND